MLSHLLALEFQKKASQERLSTRVLIQARLESSRKKRHFNQANSFHASHLRCQPIKQVLRGPRPPRDDRI